MRPIDRSDVLDRVAYEKVRESFRDRLIELKKQRRIGLGDHLTFIFENRETVLFQIQMLRAERVVDEGAIQEEIDVYNALIPEPGELSATLMIEIAEMSQIRPELDRLVGIDEHVELWIDETRIQASFDPKQFEEDRISAVQYIRFPIGPELALRFQDPDTPVVLRVVHSNYQAETPITGPSRTSLAQDLEDDGA